MKNWSICVSIFVGILLSSSISFAQNVATGTIATIEPGWAGEGIYIVLVPTPAPAPPATTCSDTRILMPLTTPLYKDNVAVLLAARSLDAGVVIYYSSTCIPPNNSYAFVGVQY
jgi:hypothetical protein